MSTAVHHFIMSCQVPAAREVGLLHLCEFIEVGFQPNNGILVTEDGP
jgi:hypothetical protein